jgi:hypothetical protein
MLALGLAISSSGCGVAPQEPAWQAAVRQQTQQLGYRNWIVIAEASFPAHNRPGVRQVTATVDVPEAVDFVLQALEQTEHVRPVIYLTRELRSVENDFAPGIEEFRQRIRGSLHGHEPTELDQQALLVLLEDANRSFNVLVVRTPTALPYSSVFLELQPGYWDAESEARLRERIERERAERIERERERMDRLVHPIP